jgi:hypothetical protein
MRLVNARIASAAVAAAVVISSASPSLAASAPLSGQTLPAQPSAWMALSMLSANGAVGLAGAAAQPNTPADDAPPPLAHSTVQSPPVPVIAVWLATVAAAVYILTRDHHGRFQFPRPNSPG